MGINEVKDSVASLRMKIQDQAVSAKDTEGVNAALTQKVSQTANSRTASVARQVSILEAKSGWVHVDGDDGDEVRSLGSSSRLSCEGVGMGVDASDLQQVVTCLTTLEAKVDIQLEQSKTQGVIFHKIVFSSEMEFMQWYLKENTSGKGLAGFVDLTSIWTFASLYETAMEWLQSLSRQRTEGLDNKAEMEYLHSMSTHYPVAFVGKAELLNIQDIREVGALLEGWRCWRRHQGTTPRFAAHGGGEAESVLLGC